jgi:protein TonB
VGADGKPLEVSIAKSSGFSRLDEIARETVLRSWRFVPARQGDQPWPAPSGYPSISP